jgi:hypothetical protein
VVWVGGQGSFDVRGGATHLLDPSPDIVLSRLQTIQKAEELVARLVAPWSAV